MVACWLATLPLPLYSELFLLHSFRRWWCASYIQTPGRWRFRGMFKRKEELIIIILCPLILIQRYKKTCNSLVHLSILWHSAQCFGFSRWVQRECSRRWWCSILQTANILLIKLLNFRYWSIDDDDDDDDGNGSKLHHTQSYNDVPASLYSNPMMSHYTIESPL